MTLEKKKRFIVDFLFLGIWVLIAFVLLRYGLPALAPFALAVVFSYLLKVPTRWLQRRLKLPWKAAAALVVLLFYCTVGLVFVILVIRVVSEIVTIVGQIPVLYDSYVMPIVDNISENIEQSIISMDPSMAASVEYMVEQFVESVGEILSGLSMNVMSAVSGFTSSLPGLFVKIVLLVISTFFIMMDYDKLTGFFYRQLNARAKRTFLEVKGYVAGTLFICIRSYALIMSITFVELSIGLTILRLDSAVLLALIISFFDILPVLGTGGIMIPWAVITALQGNYSLALGLLIVYIVITVIRNIIEPKIVGKQIGLHPVLTLSSMFLGVQLFGVVGLFGFPIGLSLLRHLNDNGIIHVYKTGKN